MILSLLKSGAEPYNAKACESYDKLAFRNVNACNIYFHELTKLNSSQKVRHTVSQPACVILLTNRKQCADMQHLTFGEATPNS